APADSGPPRCVAAANRFRRTWRIWTSTRPPSRRLRQLWIPSDPAKRETCLLSNDGARHRMTASQRPSKASERMSEEPRKGLFRRKPKDPNKKPGRLAQMRQVYELSAKHNKATPWL